MLCLFVPVEKRAAIARKCRRGLPGRQAAIDKKLTDDAELSTLGITATVLNGKVTLVGTVKTEALKTQVEKVVKHVKGVKEVDNQIIVLAG